MIKLLLSVVITASGQWPAFGVYHTAGTIKCTSTRGGGVTRSVVDHSWLYAGDKLMLLDNIAEIILFDRDTNYIRLHGKGRYSIPEIEKMQRTHVRDNVTVRYLSLLWEELARPATGTQLQKEKIAGSTGGVERGIPFMLAPPEEYATSMDSLIFRWRKVNWAHKYFLRLRGADGELRFDSVIADTQVVVHFPGRMSAGNSYNWTLDIVGESGRLQFADSNHITLIDESAVLPKLQAVPADSIGGIVTVLEQVEQYEKAGCTKSAEALLKQLTRDFPQDGALDKLYVAFRNRNYF